MVAHRGSPRGKGDTPCLENVISRSNCTALEQENDGRGAAWTLMALTPVFLLPLSALVFKEPIRSGAVYGTLAMVGVALLFLT